MTDEVGSKLAHRLGEIFTCAVYMLLCRCGGQEKTTKRRRRRQSDVDALAGREPDPLHHGGLAQPDQAAYERAAVVAEDRRDHAWLDRPVDQQLSHDGELLVELDLCLARCRVHGRLLLQEPPTAHEHRRLDRDVVDRPAVPFGVGTPWDTFVPRWLL